MKFIKISMLIVCICFSTVMFSQFYSSPFINSTAGYNSGLANINVVGTSSTIQTATFANPARMFEKKIATHLSFNILDNNFSIKQENYSAGFHYSFERFAVGVYHNQNIWRDIYYSNDLSDFFNGMTGIAGAYKLNSKWQIGLNVNLYSQRLNNFDDLDDNYLTSGLSTSYADKKILSNNNEINWTFGLAINNVGQKQNNLYLPSQGKIGGTFGYLIALNEDKSSNVHFTFLYQADKILQPDNGNTNYGAIQAIFVSLWDEGNKFSDEFGAINHRIGLETAYNTKSQLSLAFRLSNETYTVISSNLFNIGFSVGYKDFYLSSGYHTVYNSIIEENNGTFGAELGYQLDF